MARIGRPVLAKQHRRLYRVVTRVNVTQDHYITRASRKAGQSRAEWVRSLIAAALASEAV